VEKLATTDDDLREKYRLARANSNSRFITTDYGIVFEM
jgi:hypothetical protein